MYRLIQVVCLGLSIVAAILALDPGILPYQLSTIMGLVTFLLLINLLMDRYGRKTTKWQ